MKKRIAISILFCLGISLTYANNHSKEETSIVVKDTLIGYFNLEQLKAPPYNSWFEYEYQNYTIDTITLKQIDQKALQNIEITIVIGTWCSDSRRETPRLMKALDFLDFNSDQITAIGVNRKKEAVGTTVDELKIEYVPTIILFRNNQEIGRIIETPNESIEKDLAQIVSHQ